MRLLFASLAAVVLVCVKSAVLWADRAEPETREPAKETGTVLVDPNKPPEVKSNYQQPTVPLNAKTQQAASEPIQLLPAPESAKKAKAASKKKRRARREEKRRSRSSTSQKPAQTQITHSAWWDETGNQAVWAFRDCVSEYAASHPSSRTSYGKRLLISTAMDTDCREQFDAMATLIVARFGREKFTTLSTELIDEVFAPAVGARSDGRQVSASGG